MGARNSEINIPARPNTAVADRCGARIESAKRLRLCLTPWPWRVRCGAPDVCLLFIIILVVVVLVVLVSVGVDRRRVANNTIPPHYRHPPDKGKRRANERLHVPLLLAAYLARSPPSARAACPMLPVAA